MLDECNVMRPFFAGRRAVVTGGSSGIGREIVLTLTELGCETFFCGRNRETGEKTAADCRDGRGHFEQLDVTDAGKLGSWIKSFASLDYLINNVADDRRVKMEDISAVDFDRAVAVNLRAAFTASLAAIPALRKGKGRAIVNVGTCNYMNPEKDCLLYNVAKSGIVGLTHSLARQLGGEFIRVNTFTPGWIATPKQLALNMDEEAKKMLRSTQALPVILDEKSVMGPLLFLLSPLAGAVTGQNLLAEGGRVML